MLYSVNSKKQKNLENKMQRLHILNKDIVQKFIRSHGKGGQRLNKVSTCVYLKHIPTGIEVKCQKTRYQALNRFLAYRILVDKIEQTIMGRKSEIQQRIEKIRRQKRKRSKRAKEKVLREKRMQSEKKKLRAFRTDLNAE